MTRVLNARPPDQLQQSKQHYRSADPCSLSQAIKASAVNNSTPPLTASPAPKCRRHASVLENGSQESGTYAEIDGGGCSYFSSLLLLPFPWHPYPFPSPVPCPSPTSSSPSPPLLPVPFPPLRSRPLKPAPGERCEFP